MLETHPFDVSQLKHQSVPFERYKNTSEHVRETKYEGGHETVFQRKDNGGEGEK